MFTLLSQKFRFLLEWLYEQVKIIFYVNFLNQDNLSSILEKFLIFLKFDLLFNCFRCYGMGRFYHHRLRRILLSKDVKIKLFSFAANDDTITSVSKHSDLE